MKVILLKDVPKLGQRGDVKDVADGFAMNSLFPRKLAEIATPEKVAAQEKQAQEKNKATEELYTRWRAALKALDEGGFGIIASANEQKHLYKQITAADIAAAFAKQTGEEIPESQFTVDDQIKTLGEHTVHVEIENAKHPLIVRVHAD